MAKKQPEWLKIEDVTRKLPVTLSAEEREKLKDRENAQGERVLMLERKHDEIRASEKEEARARREEIKDARAAWSEVMDARRTGTEHREFKCQVRAVIKTQSIDVVRVKDGEIVETRPMNEEERLKYLQSNLFTGDDADAKREDPNAPTQVSHSWDGGPFVPVVAPGDATPEGEDEPAATDGDTLPDDECDAIQVPHGWPRPWMERRWRVEGAPLPLTGSDVAQVYHSLSSSGSTLDELVADGAPSAYLGRPHVARSLALLLGRELVVKTDEGRWFAKVEAPPEPTEAGRNDTLPEAADAKKPKRRRAKDTGEAAINTALGQSEAMEAGA